MLKIPVFRAQGADLRARISRDIIANVAGDLSAYGVNPSEQYGLIQAVAQYAWIAWHVVGNHNGWWTSFKLVIQHVGYQVTAW